MTEKVIYTHIYNPCKSLFKSSKNDKSELHIHTCKNPEACSAYKQGQCLNVSNAFGTWCPEGRRSKRAGYTRRASKFSSEIRKWEEQNKDTLHILSRYPNKIYKVDKGWMLPYNHMDMIKGVYLLDEENCGRKLLPFISDENFTKEVFSSLLTARPQAFFGGEITSYQKEVVPKFVKDLHDLFPEKFEEIAGENERAKRIIDSFDNRGRKAYLKTVNPSRVKVKKDEYWDWDGERISKTDDKFMIFQPISWTGCGAYFIPDDNATIEITDNAQVNENTKFAD